MATPALPSGFVVENAPTRADETPFRRGERLPLTIRFRRVDPRTVRLELATAGLVIVGSAYFAYRLQHWGPTVLAALLAIGLYAYVREAFGRVIVHVDDDSLVLSEGSTPQPVFWGDVARIAQVYRVAEWARQGSEDPPEGDALRVDQAQRYAVWVEMTDGAQQCLVSGLTHRDQAQYLEDLIEARLGLADRPVEGEMPKNRD